MECDFKGCEHEAQELIPYRQRWEDGDSIHLRNACDGHIKIAVLLTEAYYEDLIWYLQHKGVLD